MTASIEQMIKAAVEKGVRQALMDHVPPVAGSVTAVSRSLGVSEPVVRQLVNDGHLPTVPNTGRRVLIPLAALERFANSGVKGVERRNGSPEGSWSPAQAPERIELADE